MQENLINEFKNSIQNDDNLRLKEIQVAAHAACIPFIRGKCFHPKLMPDEIFHDTISNLVLKIKGGKALPDDMDFFHLVRRTAWYLILSRLSGNHSPEPIPISEIPPSKEPFREQNSNFENAQEVKVILAQISKKCKTHFVLRFFKGLSDGEIAEILDMPLDQVRKKRHKCFKEIRNKYKGNE